MMPSPVCWPAVAVCALIVGCGAPPPAGVQPSPLFVLADHPSNSGFELLFGGTDLDAWRGFGTDDVPDGWSIQAGALYCSGRFGTPDLITREMFGDFELVLEFMTDSADRNSGILYRVTEGHSQTYHSGPEFQILDAESNPPQSTGANYALHDPEGVVLNGPGEWNEARIIASGAAVEHWLNGRRIVAYELWTPDWEQRVADSKFARWPDYGRARTGHIALQSHGDPVWFRNIRVRTSAP